MQTRAVADIPTSAIGLGGASWSLSDHPAFGATGPPDDERMIQTIHAALDAGVRLVDTARAYTSATHPGHSEAIVARALAAHPAGADTLVVTKGGHYRDGAEFPIDARAEAIRRHCELSRRLLGVETLDVYLLHWPDPEIPMAEAMATFAELRDEGAIRHVGVSNVTVAQLEDARAVVPIVCVENRFSVYDQTDREMIDHCTERGIAYLAYSPLRGSEPLTTAFPKAAALARRKGVSVHRLALAWLLTLSPAVIPVCGASRPETIRDAALAPEVVLSDEELRELDFLRAP